MVRRRQALSMVLFCVAAAACSGDDTTPPVGDAGDVGGADGSDDAGDTSGDDAADADDEETSPDVVEETGPDADASGDGSGDADPDSAPDEDVAAELDEPAPDVTPDVGPPPDLDELRATGAIDLRLLERRGIALGELNFAGATHLNVAAIEVQPDGTCAFGEEGDADAIRSLIREDGPVVIVSVGGFGDGSANFAAVAADSTTRQRFGTTCAGLVSDVGAAGLDVYWWNPGAWGPEPETQWPNYVELLRSTRAALDTESPDPLLELSFFGPGDLGVVPAASLAEAVSIVDSVATISFDFIGSWDLSSTGFAASLFAPSGYSVDLVVGAWRATGADVSKLQIGMALYGWGWQGVSSIDNGLFQVPGGPAESGDVVTGRFAYDDLDPIPTGFSRFYDSERRAPWLYSPTGEVFITYEDRVSAAAKAQYVIDQGLGGVMGTEISYDRRGVLLGTVVRTFQRAAEGSGDGSGE